VRDLGRGVMEDGGREVVCEDGAGFWEVGEQDLGEGGESVEECYADYAAAGAELENVELGLREGSLE